MAFLDPNKPLVTCKVESCTDCPVEGSVTCHFRPQQLLHFLLVSLPGFIIGAAGILTFGPRPFVLWLAIIIGFFGLLEIRVMCSHCPHYAEPGGTLKCWANHGSPKLWKYRPGPMSILEKAGFFGGFAAVWLYPLGFLVAAELWFLLALYVLTNTGFFVTLKMFLCSRCMNFACPLNDVGEEVRELFFARNPVVARAWGKDPEA